VREFYVPSWELFVSYITSTSTPYHNTSTLPQFNRTEWQEELLRFEQSWQTKLWGSSPHETCAVQGDAASVALDVFKKWKPQMLKYYEGW
jgi:hypothetical protein